MRIGGFSRKTMETDISVRMIVDGRGECMTESGIAFLDHMLRLLALNWAINLEIRSKGDLEVDDHHLVEDLGFALGKALDEALSDRKGIRRYGYFLLPMDEALCEAALDLGGRPFLRLEAEFARERIGSLSTELVYDFFDAFARGARLCLSIRLIEGRNDHHKAEVIFKAVGRALRMACETDERIAGVPSTKEVI
jgi:imidazoleglycerol-phosphate dehydratase